VGGRVVNWGSAAALPMNRPSPRPSPPSGGGWGWVHGFDSLRILEVFPAHEPGGTSNIEHPTRTSNGSANPRSLRRSVFDVGCSMFSLGSGLRRANFHFGRSLHEPPLSRPSATLSPPCGERAGRGVPIWFMVPMHAKNERGLSMNRPLTPSLSPSDGERVAEGRVRGGSWSQCERKSEWNFP